MTKFGSGRRNALRRLTAAVAIVGSTIVTPSLTTAPAHASACVVKPLGTENHPASISNLEQGLHTVG